MDGSREQPKMTAGLDLGDKYTYLCLIDTQSGEVKSAFRNHHIGRRGGRAYSPNLGTIPEMLGFVLVSSRLPSRGFEMRS